MTREYDYLVELSGTGTVEDLRDNLMSLGIKGTIRSFEDCPLANALEAEFGISYGIGKKRDRDKLCIWKGTEFLAQSVEMPEAAKEFMSYFDNGAIPELVK